MSTCLHPRCQATIPASRLACAPHWYQLSPELRKHVYATWRSRQATGDAGPHRAAMVDAIEEWKAAL
jgi:hypothetical protein